MRFFAPLFALFAAVAVAQTSGGQQNYINIPGGTNTLDIKAGQNTITWSNPSSGTVTIKLQQGSNITPSSGYVVASGIPASAGTATFNIPADVVNSAQYVFQIIDDTNPSNYNFSNNFVIQGATGTQTGFATGSASSTGTATGTASSTGTSSGATMTNTASSSSGTASSTGSSSTSASRSSSSSSSAATTATTAVANTNGAQAIQINGGLLALLAGAIVAF